MMEMKHINPIIYVLSIGLTCSAREIGNRWSDSFSALVRPQETVFTLIQVRHITAKQRKRKLKSRQPTTPVISKVKKIKIKSYSSYKGRFRVMNDGQIRRWKEGKRHNAHSKSKKSKRRLRQPGTVPLAYAKLMKKLNFCA